MKHLFHLTLLYGISIIVPPNFQQYERSIAQNDMQVQWKIEDQRIHFEVFAPTQGWVALGLNSESSLSKTQLIMGNMQKEALNLVEHYVLQPGDYRPVESLEQTSVLADQFGAQCAIGSTFRFSLPLNANDDFHQNWQEGQSLYLLIAYSNHDDFQHHSVMRSWVEVEL